MSWSAKGRLDNCNEVCMGCYATRELLRSSPCSEIVSKATIKRMLLLDLVQFSTNSPTSAVGINDKIATMSAARPKRSHKRKIAPVEPASVNCPNCPPGPSRDVDELWIACEACQVW